MNLIIVSEGDEYFADMVDVVNRKRRRRLLGAWTMDEEMQEMARYISMRRASDNIRGHLRSRDFTKVCSHEGVGWYGRIDWQGLHFTSCYLYSVGFRYCGAAMAVRENGISFYTLLLRR